MATANISRKTVRSISEWSVFKITIIAYLIFFALGVVMFGIFLLIIWGGLTALGQGLEGLLESTGLSSTMESFGINITDMSMFVGGLGATGIIIFVIVGLIFSVVYAAISTFTTWILNVILKISGGLELRFIDKNDKSLPEPLPIENKPSEPVESVQPSQSD